MCFWKILGDKEILYGWMWLWKGEKYFLFFFNVFYSVIVYGFLGVNYLFMIIWFGIFWFIVKWKIFVFFISLMLFMNIKNYKKLLLYEYYNESGFLVVV